MFDFQEEVRSLQVVVFGSQEELLTCQFDGDEVLLLDPMY